jgi:hypothetical protein
MGNTIGLLTYTATQFVFRRFFRYEMKRVRIVHVPSQRTSEEQLTATLGSGHYWLGPSTVEALLPAE